MKSEVDSRLRSSIGLKSPASYVSNLPPPGANGCCLASTTEKAARPKRATLLARDLSMVVVQDEAVRGHGSVWDSHMVEVKRLLSRSHRAIRAEAPGVCGAS